MCGINRGFPRLSPTKGQVIHVLLTRSPLLPKKALDLHVLSPPQAFALSQDQTLQFNLVLYLPNKAEPCLSAWFHHLLLTFQRPGRPTHGASATRT